ncbi:MAG: hypothetical protein BZ135_07685 [Methanosphaera sp. rholeuAM6]|nr:MAG: hypothetical protein BZ135_07685 [Methanosphaera sp. rholeuAM6]
MQIDEKWYKLFEKLYGKKFNRLLTVGTADIGYTNYDIRKLDEIRPYVEEGFPQNEFYISLYSYKTEDKLSRWNAIDLEQYEKYANKNCLLFRFKQNTDIIQEETSYLDDIEKFMFIRRSINLGCNKNIVQDCNKVYNFFKTHFNIKGTMMFNGFDECLLYYYTDEIALNNPSLTYYNIPALLKQKLDIPTLLYENIEPFAQLVPLPGTQNSNSRLYTQLFHPDFDYEHVMSNSQEKFLDESHLSPIEKSKELEQFIKDIDDEIDNTKTIKFNFNEIWEKIN